MASAKTQGKLRGLKDFLSSTRSLNRSSQNQSYKSHHQLSCDSSSSVIADKKNSVSLFDLVDPPLNSSRPTSVCMSHNGAHSNGFGYKSVSTYGLSNRCDDPSDAIVQTNATSTSKNPAVRLYHTIRAKFRKRRKDRGNKILDSKSSDFGPYISTRNSASSGSAFTLTGGNDTSLNSSNMWFDSGNSNGNAMSHPVHPRSMNNLDQVDLLEDAFIRPLGYRDDPEAEMDASPRCTNSSSSNNNRSSSNSLDNICQESRSSTLTPKDDEAKVSTYPVPKPNPTGALRSKALTAELCDLLHYGWYWGGLSKEEADEKLKGEPDGAFVVRDSSSNHYLLSLSFNSNGKTLHTRIEYRNGLFCFYASETECFPSVAELIEYWIATSQSGAFCYIKSRRADVPSYPVRLTQPVSRFTEVKSLRYLSRFVIRQYVRLDLIPQLPLPQTLINYISQQRYI